jgi:hypothetical protein
MPCPLSEEPVLRLPALQARPASFGLFARNFVQQRSMLFGQIVTQTGSNERKKLGFSSPSEGFFCGKFSAQ